MLFGHSIAYIMKLPVSVRMVGVAMLLSMGRSYAALPDSYGYGRNAIDHCETFASEVPAAAPLDSWSADSAGGIDDTTATRDSLEHSGDTLRYISEEEFTHAGARRYTLYGDLPLRETRIDPLRAAIAGGLVGGAWAWLHLNMSGAWWENRSGFHLKDDWNNVLQIDKAGHAYSGYMMSYGFGEALMATGVSWESSVLWGSGIGLAYQTYVELEDGFSEGWGFSLSDMGANMAGAGLYLGHHYSPFLQNFTPKYLYVPPSWIDAPKLSTTWIDDYNSSSFWLGMKVRNLLPRSTRDVWPAWLDVALGYGVIIDDSTQRRRVLIALDYDLVQLLPDGGNFWNWLRQTLNYIKLPAPALQLAPDLRFHLLFPFTFRAGEIRF